MRDTSDDEFLSWGAILASKPIIFISHISEEANLAAIFRQHIPTDFLSLVDVFVSSDTESISAGRNWLTSIESALRDACVELILGSKVSIKRPWINFEAGAAWMKGIPVVPVCHTELRPRDPPMPFSVLQAVEANQESGLRQIYALIARKLESEVPHPDFTKLIEEIQSFETEYTIRLKELIKDDIGRKEAVLTRVKNYLDERKPAWRTIRRIANRCAVSEGEALELLILDPDIEFAKDGLGNRIARMKSRTDTGQAPPRTLSTRRTRDRSSFS